ncbi:hypothetical protein GF366_03485 [Candidatus Peregrinibacteria bacterium]|nr:hypothetical protein [Candidatus Peregrinibacteria bacterium]
MNIAKVIKVYFYFIMVLMATASLTFNEEVKYFIVSAFHFDEQEYISDASPSGYSANIFAGGSSKIFIAENDNPNLINFSIMNDPEKSFAEPGSKGIYVMDFVFKTKNESMVLRKLTLKVVGVDSENILKAALVKGNKPISEARHKDGYLIFDNINFKIDNDSRNKLALKVSLSPNLQTGQRIRMDIEKPSDIEILVGGRPYTINKYYPIEGEYLSIARSK